MNDREKLKPRKKLWVVLLTAVMLTACGSGVKSTKPIDVAEDFESKVCISENDFTAEADIKRCGADMWECSFSSPETIKGMTVAKSSGEWIIAHEGINYTLSEENMPSASMVKLVIGCVDKLIAKSDLVCTTKDSVTTESGVISGQDFSAEFKDDKLCEIQIAKTITAKLS